MGLKCKYYRPIMDCLLEYCKDFYQIDGCAAGGYLHILLDDDNYTDDDIKYCMRECYEHFSEPGSKLGFWICSLYLNMTMEERALFDSVWTGQSVLCEDQTRCSNCSRIDYGYLDY